MGELEHWQPMRAQQHPMTLSTPMRELSHDQKKWLLQLSAMPMSVRPFCCCCFVVVTTKSATHSRTRPGPAENPIRLMMHNWKKETALPRLDFIQSLLECSRIPGTSPVAVFVVQKEGVSRERDVSPSLPWVFCFGKATSKLLAKRIEVPICTISTV